MNARPPKAARAPHSWRRRAHDALDPAVHPTSLSLTNKLLMAAILVAAALAILETEPTILQDNFGLFVVADVVLSLIFAVEYAVRFWSAAEMEQLGGGWKARFRWMVTPTALLDLAATLPVLLLSGQVPSYVLRLVRLVRLARFAKLGRFSRSFRLLAEVVASRRHDLLATLVVGGVLLVLSSALLYLAEGEVQPDVFGSIPRAMWWGVVTLTTIGYGDVYPVTALGKVLASATAVLGIGLIAAPTGILAAAFAEALRNGDKVK